MFAGIFKGAHLLLTFLLLILISFYIGIEGMDKEQRFAVYWALLMIMLFIEWGVAFVWTYVVNRLINAQVKKYYKTGEYDTYIEKAENLIVFSYGIIQRNLINNNISSAYAKKQEFEKAYYYSGKIKLRISGNKIYRCAFFMNRVDILFMMGNKYKALEEYEKCPDAAQIDETLKKLPHMILPWLFVQACVAFENKDTDKGRALYNELASYRENEWEDNIDKALELIEERYLPKEENVVE